MPGMKPGMTKKRQRAECGHPRLCKVTRAARSLAHPMARNKSWEAAAPLAPAPPALAAPRPPRRRRARYSKALAASICRRLAQGEALRALTRDPAMPSRKTLKRWMKRDVDGLFAQCRRRVCATPRHYPKKIAAKIARRLGRGEALAAICRDPGMPTPPAIRHWIETDRDGLFAECPRTPGKGGAPSRYTKRLADRICRRLAGGRSLASIARDPGMPAAATVVDWVNRNVDGFRAAYERARLLGYDSMIDEILDIADDSAADWIEIPGKGRRLNRENLQRARVRISARRWLFAKMQPYHARNPLVVEIVRFADGDDVQPRDEPSRAASFVCGGGRR
jgi:hypothetical protein